MKVLSRFSLFISLFLLFFLSSSVFAGSWNTNKNGVVLDGYDVVSYQTQDKAVKGSSKYSTEYDGVKFYFSSKKNKKLFVKNVTKYIPKYNGYCAFAMAAKNAKVPANADTFKIYNGELMVFFNDFHDGTKFNTKIPWNASEKNLYSKAESNWKKLK